jgi:hypothetical protein
MFNKTTSDRSLFNISSCLGPPLGMTKFIIVTGLILVMLYCANCVRLKMFNKPISEARFVEQRLMLSSTFRHDQIHNCHSSDFGLTLL